MRHDPLFAPRVLCLRAVATRLGGVGDAPGTQTRGRRQVPYASKGESNMPTTVNLQLIGVWFCVGFFAGAGWAVAAWLVARTLGRLL